MARKRRIFSVKQELLAKSREAALAAVQIYNNPLVRFKSESFIVLMIIAWTYLLHAYYRENTIEYRYYKSVGSKRRFDRTKRGAFKFWELERCLDCDETPIDKATASNLRFLIGLRHEIEHEMSLNLDSYLSARYQACCLNYNDYIKNLFGDQHGIDQYLAFSLQFSQLSYEQAIGVATAEDVPPRLRAYIAEFDDSISADELDSQRFSYRLLFTRRIVGKKGQADRVVEFIDPKSEPAAEIDKYYVGVREVERPKYSPGQIVNKMRADGFPKFNMHHHTLFWKAEDARKPALGYGVRVVNTWFWYEAWVTRVRSHCEENAEKYR